MIQIDDIHIEEFRGIRDLVLQFNLESFVVWGPNGTGKSGVVDALDFVLTGAVSRLKGPGSGSLSLRRHAPHVLRQGNPAAARVTATITDTTTGETARLSRSVDTASSYSLDPDTPAMRTAVERISRHPEVTLSRRDILKFVLVEPGRRSEEIQALLKLERLGEFRSALRSAKTKTSSTLVSAGATLESEIDSVNRHFGIQEADESEMLTVINKHRAVLGLAPFEVLDVDDVSIGMVEHEQVVPFTKETAIRDIEALTSEIENPSKVSRAVAVLEDAVAPVVADSTLLREMDSARLVEDGLALLVDEACPLCGHEWPDIEALRAQLNQRVERSAHATQTKEKIERASQSLADAVAQVRELGATVHRIAVDLDLPTANDLQSWIDDIVALESALKTPQGVLQLREELSNNPLRVPVALVKAVVAIRQAVEAVPDTTGTAESTKFLALAHERFTKLRCAQEDLRLAAVAVSAADGVYQAYCDAQDDVLTSLYEDVTLKFGDYYRAVNTDEDGFAAVLEPSAGRLDLAVDFYGLGMFPPAAYHSEGHQDGMGVCLYLALMRELLGDDFRLAVLDDVVMSVDKGHRHQFCELLRDEFPEVQFIITTHDDTWARQMQRLNLVSRGAQVHFVQWDVDNGPWVADGVDFWDEIEEALQADDVPEAAWRLRRNLERILGDLADEYRCSITYNAANSYGLGDFLDAVKGRYGKLLKKAAAAANSWNDADAIETVAVAKDEWESISARVNADLWVLNPAVHYNDFASFSKADLEPLVIACKDFLEVFECTECRSRLYVAQHQRKDDSLRCAGGHFNLNLRTKE